MQSFQLLNDQVWPTGVEQEIQKLFSENGTVYLVSGFFTYNAFDRLRPDIASFLRRSPENELVIMASMSADQFSPQIVRELSKLDDGDQVEIWRYRDGFMHAKLYFRDGSTPAVVLGSANLTKVAMAQNFELCVSFEPNEPQLDELQTFVDALLERCQLVRQRDLFTPLMIYRTIANWSNKGRMITPRTMIRHPVRVGIALMIATSLWFLMV